MPRTRSTPRTYKTRWFQNSLTCPLSFFSACLSVLGVRRSVFGDLLFIFVAYRQQHVLGVIQITALFAVIFEYTRLDDRVHRAGFFAKAAEDALGQVDVVLRGAPCAVLAFGHFDLCLLYTSPSPRDRTRSRM